VNLLFDIAFYALRLIQEVIGVNRPGPVSSVPRGPPRKPKQSGHALWVGNLPPGTTVVALKDHFSRDATKDIESLFLISKSNCAFVNYRTEASCTAAMHRFHDSRFNGVRLVCRLRRSSAPASGVPTGPSAMLGNQPSASPPRSPHVVDGEDTQVDGESTPNRTTSEESRLAAAASERYFIVKSLTLQDLESSVRNGIWATQSHNEDVLNKAYQASLFEEQSPSQLRTNDNSLRRMSTSSSRLTNRANILAMHAWRPPFSKVRKS
jgi:RNA recognition motif-containing protein